MTTRAPAVLIMAQNKKYKAKLLQHWKVGFIQRGVGRLDFNENMLAFITAKIRSEFEPY